MSLLLRLLCAYKEAEFEFTGESSNSIDLVLKDACEKVSIPEEDRSSVGLYLRVEDKDLYFSNPDTLLGTYDIGDGVSDCVNRMDVFADGGGRVCWC